MNDLPPLGCSLRSPWAQSQWSLLTISYPMRGPGGQAWGRTQEDADSNKQIQGSTELFFLMLARGTFGDTHSSSARQPRRAAVPKASRERHLTSPRSLAPGLAFLCLPLVCCRNPRLFGLQGKERHLGMTLDE